MLKSGLFVLFLSVLFLNSCAQSKDRTEIIIQFSEAGYLHSISNYAEDSLFLKALNHAMVFDNQGKNDFVKLWADQVLQIDSNCKLSGFFTTYELRDKIKFSSSNQEVIAVLTEEIKAAKQQAILVLKKRLESSFNDAPGLSKLFDKTEVIFRKIDDKKYSIVIKRKADKTRLTNLLQMQANLGFWETYNFKEVFSYLNDINTKLKDSLNSKEEKKRDGKEKTQVEKDNPLFNILIPPVSQDGQPADGSVVGTSLISDTSKVNQYLANPKIKNLLPRNLKLIWETKPIKNHSEYINLYALKITSRDGNPPLDGNCIVEANAKKTNMGTIVIGIKMNNEGARIWSRMTRENIDKQIAIVFNNSVYSCPRVMSEIKDGSTEITGNFSDEEANDLASLLNAGMMSAISVKVLSINESSKN